MRYILLFVLICAARSAFAETSAEPVGLVRLSFIHSDSETRSIVVNGKPLTLDSSKADPSPFGYRRGFVMENAQFGVMGNFVADSLSYVVRVEMVPREKDGNRSADYLRDAYATWKSPWIDVRAGWQKVPFSQANLKATQDMPLPYAPVFDVLQPQRLLGAIAAVHDPEERVKLTVGAFNSAKQALEQTRDYDQLLYAGRLEVTVDKILGSEEFKWRIAANAMQTKQYFDTRSEQRWTGLDSRAAWRFLQAEAEVVALDFYGDADTSGNRVAHRGWGWHFDLTGQVWRDVLSVTGRVESMDGDDKLANGATTQLTIDDLSRQKKRWWTLGLGYKPTANGRCVLALIHREELEGRSFANDSGQLTCQLAF